LALVLLRRRGLGIGFDLRAPLCGLRFATARELLFKYGYMLPAARARSAAERCLISTALLGPEISKKLRGSLRSWL
jgi:hypothetical protein